MENIAIANPTLPGALVAAATSDRYAANGAASDGLNSIGHRSNGPVMAFGVRSTGQVSVTGTDTGAFAKTWAPPPRREPL